MTEPSADAIRMVEALLFAATEPLDAASLEERLPEGVDVPACLAALEAQYAERGVNLVRRGDRWLFQTAPDLAFLLQRDVEETVKLSRAASETLAIIAYHQPVSRAEIEQVRGVAVSKGTLDVLLETGWVRPRGRRQSPGRPMTYGTTDQFLLHFGMESIDDLPGLSELKAAGLMDPEPPAGFTGDEDGENAGETQSPTLPFTHPSEGDT